MIEYEKNHLSRISISQSKEDIQIEDDSSKNHKDKIIYIRANVPLNEQEKSEIDNINNDLKEENDNLEDEYEL